MKKRLVQLLLVVTICITLSGTSYATESVPIEMEMQAASFSVTLPMSLPITILADGLMLTGRNVRVYNNSVGPVEISDIRVYSDVYTIVNMADDMSTGKKFAMSINGMSSTSNGMTLEGFMPVTIMPSDSMPVLYWVKTTFHSEAEIVPNAASVVFTAKFVVEPPSLGDSVTIGDFTYNYGNGWNGWDWEPPYDHEQLGYGVTVSDRTKSEYGEPLTEINGVPVVSWKGLYSDCDNLLTHDISSFNMDSVMDFHCMYYDCDNLVSLVCNGATAENVVDYGAMLESCDKLETVTIPSFNFLSANTLDYMFGYCGYIKDVYVKDESVVTLINNAIGNPALGIVKVYS